MKASVKSILLTASATLFLYFSGFLTFATPVPVIYFSMRYRREDVLRFVGGLLVVAGLIHFIVVPWLNHLNAATDIVVSIAPTSFIDILGTLRAACLEFGRFVVYLALGYLITRLLKTHVQEAPRYIFYFTTGLFIVVSILILIVIGPHFPELVDVYRAQTLAGFKDFLTAQEQAGLGFEKLVMLQSLLPGIVKHSVYMMPFGLWLFVVVLFVLNLILFRNYFVRLPFAKRGSQLCLGSFRMPFLCVWCVIALVSALLFNVKFGHSLLVFYFALNVLAALVFAYFLQGLAIVTFFIERKKIFGPFQFFAYLLLFFLIVSIPFVLPLLILLGFAESWVDMRKNPNETKKNGIR